MNRARRGHVLLAMLVGLALRAAPSQAESPEPTGFEYKLRLAVGLAEGDREKSFWSLVVGPGRKGKPAHVDVETKKCRLVSYLDTDDDDLQAHGFVLRHRAQLDADDCARAKPNGGKASLTLKYRSVDEHTAAEEMKKPWARVGEAKFETDLLVSKPRELRRAFSVGAKIDGAGLPTTVEELRRRFPDAVPFLPGDAKLGAGCRKVFERTRALGGKQRSDVPADVELVAWYRDVRAAPILVEASFKGDPKEHDSVVRADGLAGRLLRSIDDESLAEAGSKTEAAYDCR